MMVSIYTIGGGELIQSVLNAVAMIFHNTGGLNQKIVTITRLAFVIGGIFSIIEYMKSHDIIALMKWIGMYVVITCLVLLPTVSVNIQDMSGVDHTPRTVDNVPLSLGIFASVTSSIGIGLTQELEAILHPVNDEVSYNKTGMLMASRLILASRDFEITDPQLSESLDEFMQQCVFYDVLLRKYSINELMDSPDVWDFITNHTSQARAFALNGKVTICNTGAATLGDELKKEVQKASSIYGGQILGKASDGSALISHLANSYNALTNASADGEKLLMTNILSNTMSQSVSRFGASVNAPAALQAYMDTKSELQSRETMDLTGRQAAIWMQYFKNAIEAILYGSFILVYFLSYLPFGGMVIKNYLSGMFVIQALAPMYAIVNYVAVSLAQERSMHIIGSSLSGSSISSLAGVTQANADAIAVAGYLIWPVTIGGALMLYRGLPSAIQSMGQLMGGVVQNSGSHVVAEAVGGNISVGNTNFGNHSMNNTNANHFDTNARYSAGGSSLQTGNGSTMSIMANGNEVLDTRSGMSNMSVNVHMAESMRMAATQQAQSSLNTAFSMSRAAGEQYASGLRKIVDYGSQTSHSSSSGTSYGKTETSGITNSSNTVSNLVETFRKEHHVSHERALQVLGQVYADIKSPYDVIGASGNLSLSGRSAFGSLYNDAKQFATDHNFSEAVDHAKRESIESNYRDGSDSSNRYSNTLAKSFDSGDSYRQEASSQYSKSINYSNMASVLSENSASIDGNYNQPFYEWMRTQSSPSSQYGQGTWSKSGIDEAAVHDPALLQSYADKFVHEKTNEALASFERSNHISDHSSYINSNQVTNNSKVNSNHAVGDLKSDANETNRDFVNASMNQNSYGTVSSALKNTVEHENQSNKTTLALRSESVKSQGERLHEGIKTKIDGQIMGKLGSPDPKAAEEFIHGTADKKNTILSDVMNRKEH